mgnify:CR=1 FL=1
MSKRAMQCLTVDIDELTSYVNDGVLLYLRKGVGVVVNEVEAEAAIAALNRGEEVLCRRGQKLTGTKLVHHRVSHCYEEVDV